MEGSIPWLLQGGSMASGLAQSLGSVSPVDLEDMRVANLVTETAALAEGRRLQLLGKNMGVQQVLHPEQREACRITGLPE